MKYDDLSAAFDFVSCAGPMEHRAYISIDTGTIYWISELNPLEEEVPEDLETSDRYVAIPHKNDLDLGSDLALRFAAAELPDRHNTVAQFFRRRGAYARFKELLISEGILDKWHAFEAESTERALRDWCRASATALGFLAATRSNAKAGPSGVRRSRQARGGLTRVAPAGRT